MSDDKSKLSDFKVEAVYTTGISRPCGATTLGTVTIPAGTIGPLGVLKVMSVEKFEAELSAARNAALEEAAKVTENYSRAVRVRPHGSEPDSIAIAAATRELKGK